MIEENLKNLYDSYNHQIAVLKGQMQDVAKQLLHESFSSFFAKYEPIVDKLCWTQWAPRFNDGEECVFSIHEPFLILKEDDSVDEIEGSELYDDSSIAYLKQCIEELEHWEADPMGAAQKYRDKYIKQYRRDPFSESGGRYSVTSEEQMRRWKPYSDSKEEYEGRLQRALYQTSTFPHLLQDFEKLASVILSIDSEILKALFGEDVKVIVSANGIETESYEHY
jgi:hypothetical protein